MFLLTTCHGLLIFVHTFLSIDLKSLLSKEADCRRRSKCGLRITTHYDMLFHCIRGSLIFNLRYVSLLVLALIFSTIYSDINSSLKQNKPNVLNSWILAFGNLGYISAAICRFKQDPINTDVMQKYNSYK